MLFKQTYKALVAAQVTMVTVGLVLGAAFYAVTRKTQTAKPALTKDGFHSPVMQNIYDHYKYKEEAQEAA